MKLNENLFNLGLDAHIKAAEIADNDPVGGYEGKIWQNIYRTKFAELIIKDCLEEIDDTDLTRLEGPDPEDVIWLVTKHLKERFGIE